MPLTNIRKLLILRSAECEIGPFPTSDTLFQQPVSLGDVLGAFSKTLFLRLNINQGFLRDGPTSFACYRRLNGLSPSKKLA